MEYKLIGRIANTHGLKGELKVIPETDFIEERFQINSAIYLGKEKQKVLVKSYREHQGILLLEMVGYEDINQVEKYKGYEIYKSTDDIKPLAKGEYYFSDLKGLDAYVNGEKKGRVIDVEAGTKANNLRILKEDGKTALVPFLPVFVTGVDLESRRIDIIEMAGLL